MESTWVKILTVVLSIFLGWVAGQGGEIFREWLRRRRLSRDLIEELKFLGQIIPGQIAAYEESIHMAARQIIDPRITLNLEHPIYQNFYKDVCSTLTSAQRNSFQIIHSSIEMHNLLLTQQLVVGNLELEGSNADALDKWTNLINTQYGNLRILLFRIEFHLMNLTRKTGEISEYDEASFEDYMAQVVAEQKKLINDARKPFRK